MRPRQPASGEGQLNGFAGCYRHPDRPTGVRCVRCDRPICPQCQHPAAVGFQCPDDVRAGRQRVRSQRTVAGAPLRSGPPYVTYSLIALNVVVYLATALSAGGSLADNQRSQLFQDWQLAPAYVGYNHDFYRLLTAAFLHYGPMHILFNMVALYMIGPALERIFGWWRYLVVYLLGAFGGSVMILLFGDVFGPVVGASGAIFGLFAAALVMSKVVGFDTRSLVITIVINFVITFSIPGISKWGHIGGFVLGGLASLAMLGWTLRRRPLSPRLLPIQLAGVAALVAVLAVATVVRASAIGNQPLPVRSSSAAVTHIVDPPGENYTGVITAVESPVDNR